MLTSAQEAREAYERDGYVVLRELIPEALIDALLAVYRRQLLPSRKAFFRQSTNTFERTRLSPHGYAIQSFLDIHDVAGKDVEECCLAARNIFCHAAVRQALTTLTGHPDHHLMQSMLFDQNTATPAHQDAWYLDSLPNGHLLAGWFALEDIDERAGRFYVLPGSHRVRFDDLSTRELASSRAFTQRVSAYVDEHRSELVAPALRKGDVLFWGSRTIHGSLPTQDARFSRKSLTAHYLPGSFGFGDERGRRVDVLYRMHEGMPYRAVLRRDTPIERLKVGAFNFLSERQPTAFRALVRARRALRRIG